MATPSPTASMRRWRARRCLDVVCGVAALVGVVGCGSNFEAQTQQPYQPAVGISNREGTVYALNTLVVTDGEGNGTVVSALINQAATEDRLLSVTATDGATQLRVLPLPEGGIALPPSRLVQLETTGAVRIRSDNLRAGYFVTLTFSFANAAPLELDVPVVEVVDADSPYADVPVGP